MGEPRKMYDNEFITEIGGLGGKIIAYIWLVMEYQTVQDRERRYNPTLFINVAVRAICSNPERADVYKELLEDAHKRKHLPEDRFLKYFVEKIWVDHLLGSTMEGQRL